MNRMLIPSIEGRIITGITMFVAIMLLVGWVAINEPARMAAFEQQHLGRSIERGAELYAANCSTCHGTDGRGNGGRAPGLNSPHMFGYNFVADINNEIARIERTARDLNLRIADLQDERESLFNEAAGGPTDSRLFEITERIPEIDEQVAELQARIDELDVQLAPLYDEREAQLAALEPARLRNYLPQLQEMRDMAEEQNDPLILTSYIDRSSDRLAQIAFGADLETYIITTLNHGRPGSQFVWGEENQMVSWAQRGGGPLRDDQIQDITNYILNWDKGDDWTTEDLFAVQQFARLPADMALVAAGGGPEGAGTDVDAILTSLGDLTGDAVRGEALYNGSEPAEGQPVILGCSGCHLGGVQAPDTTEQWDLAQDVRLNQPELSGYTIEQYFVESIVRPNDYIVPGYSSGIMPGQYADQLSVQDIADILAYVQSYDS